MFEKMCIIVLWCADFFSISPTKCVTVVKNSVDRNTNHIQNPPYSCRVYNVDLFICSSTTCLWNINHTNITLCNIYLNKNFICITRIYTFMVFHFLKCRSFFRIIHLFILKIMTLFECSDFSRF